MTLRIGQINYLNCFPIFSALQAWCDCSSYTFVPGVPTQLNAMLARGEVDVSSSSSIEYAKYPEDYCILPELSISSIGQVKSVLLLSKMPLVQLHCQPIAVSRESDSSVAMLRILLRNMCGFENRFELAGPTVRETLSRYPAMLVIGDTALRAAVEARDADLHVYDLGQLWWEFTGLPFVFALWIVRRDVVAGRPDDVKMLSRHLRLAKEHAYGSYGRLADEWQQTTWMGRSQLVDYWRTISYELTPLHLLGVQRFYAYAVELGIVREQPDIRMVD